MRCKNVASLIGTAGKDAELRQTKQGVPYARFSLATSKGGYKKKDGTEVPEKTQWHNIVCWRQLAEIAGKYVKKGMKIAVEGEITYGSYDNAHGQKVFVTDILANDLFLMSGPRDGGAQPQAAAPVVQQQTVFQEPDPYDPQPYEAGDDLPF